MAYAYDAGSGNGVGGDPLYPLKHRPQVALSKSVIRILQGYRVVIPAHGPIDPLIVRDLPIAILAVLAQAGLLDRAAA